MKFISRYIELTVADLIAPNTKIRCSKNGFRIFFEFSKNVEKRGFCEYCVWLNADSEACGCGIDMIDGALETLDLTLSKRVMVGFASGFLAGDK